MANTVAIVSIFLCATLAACNARCDQLFDNKVSAADKRAIVDTHNYLRSLISRGKVPGQPKGKDLRTLKWDDKLAAAAQTIANSCEFRHVKVNDNRFYVGQNLGWTGYSAKRAGTEWSAVIQRWFNEYKNFKYPSTSTGVTGHYTQVVWADTQYIGCGFTWYREIGGKWYQKLYVCNYGPGGNIVGRPPYKA